jgi:hypothetical protein
MAALSLNAARKVDIRKSGFSPRRLSGGDPPVESLVDHEAGKKEPDEDRPSGPSGSGNPLYV